jgi:hypothetical protein
MTTDWVRALRATEGIVGDTRAAGVGCDGWEPV